MEHTTKSLPDYQRGRPATERSAAPSTGATFVDHRPEAIAQREFAAAINNSPRLIAQRRLVEAIHQSPQVTSLRALSARLAQRQQFGGIFGAPAQREDGLEEESLLHGGFEPVLRQDGPEEDERLQGKFAPVQRAEQESDSEPQENNTGLPDNLKSGLESLSGMSLDNVSVHYNSALPARINALAYAQGSSIHVAPGQERHLPHEAWHVVQQAQGRVQQTMQLQCGVPINDEDGLEDEADMMGARAESNAEGNPAGNVGSFGHHGIGAHFDSEAYATGSPMAFSGAVQRKPAKDKDSDERHYHDDKHPKLRLVKEKDSLDNEFRIKDRVQSVFWKEEGDLYFIDVAMNQSLDLDKFEATREFGSFLETFKEASKLENKGSKDSEGASMHLLQQFFSNALFDTSEIDRFDYQASPLNYQVEHSYIRAAATSNVDVMKDQLLGEDYGLDKGITNDPKPEETQQREKDKVYLANQMDFRDTLHQMFRAIVVAEEPTEENLKDLLQPLAAGVADHVKVRFSEKEVFEENKKKDKKEPVKQRDELNKDIQRLENEKRLVRGDKLDGGDKELFDWITDKESYVKTHSELGKAASKKQTLTKEIKEQEELKKSWKPPPIDPNSTKKPPKSPQDIIDGLGRALEKIDEEKLRQRLKELTEKLGVDDGSLDNLSTDDASARLEKLQLERASKLDTPYGKRFVDLPKLKEQRASVQDQIQKIDGRSFDLMRDFKEAFGGLAFLDFTELLRGAKAKQVRLKLKEWTALTSKVLLEKIKERLGTDGVAQGAIDEIAKELEKVKGLGTAFFAGGMVELDNEDNGLSSPALFLESNTLAMPVKTALGKSGYVPTPTSVNRQLVKSDVPLKTIALAIVDKQLKRQPIDDQTREKLEAVRKEIEAFDPKTYKSSGGERSTQFDSTNHTYQQFCKLAAHKDEHVGLLVRPVIKLYDGIGIFSEHGKLPAFALRQLETHLLDAIADAEDIVALQRSVQNLHELAIYALELSEDKPRDPSTLPLPEGAQTPHVTHYGLNAFSHAFEGVLKQREQDGGDELQIAALNNIYFEMMQKLGYTQGASDGKLQLDQPSSAADLVKNLKPSSNSSAQVAAPDLIVLDIHPNDAAKKEIHQNEVVTLLHQVFRSAKKDARCTVLVDITLNHISEDEVWNIRNEAEPYIKSGQLNLVFNQSLTKFAQFGMDKHSGGLMFHYNNGEDWKAFNQHVAKCAEEDAVDPTIQKYFMALFEHTEKENLAYLEKVRRNSSYVYEKLQEQFSTISCAEAITLAVNDDSGTCYVAFNYEAFAAKVLGVGAPDTEVQQMAHDILYDCINQLAGNLKLPLNMRTSFGFPISNLGDINPGIRLTVGIESSELMDRYVQLLTFTNGALGREFENNGDKNLKDPDKRRQFLAEITESVKQLSDLDKQVKELREGKGAKQTSVPMSKKTNVPKPQTSTTLGGEKIDVGMGSVDHVQNSCYIASLLNLFAASPAYCKLLADNLPPKPLDDEVVLSTMEQKLSQELHAAITELRKSDGHVTSEMVESIRTTMYLMEFLQEPDDGGLNKSGSDKDSVKDSGSKKEVTSQQDATEILQKILGALTVPSSMKVGEQSRKKQGQDVDYNDHQGVVPEGIIQLPISARDIDTLDKALKRYCAEENVENFGMKLTTFKQMPSTLTFALKRFDFDGYGAKKNYRRLQVPLKFNMPQECLHPDLRNGETYEYQVVSCIEHKGGYGGGHYIAHGRTEDGKAYGNDDLRDGPRKESEQEFEDSLSRSYLYVFQRVENI